MKRICLFLFMIISSSAFSQVYHQYFDGADTSASNSLLISLDTSSSNIWQVGPPQKMIFDSAATLPNVIVTDTLNLTPNGNTSVFTFSAVFPANVFGVLALQWKQKLDMDKHHSGGKIECSIDSGQTWMNVFNNPLIYNIFGFDPINKDTLWNGDYAYSGLDTIWRDNWLCIHLSIIPNATLVYYRFTFLSDSVATPGEGWMIDNLSSHVTWLHPVKDISKSEYIQVFPNPTEDVVHIETASMQGYHIIEKMTLYDESGKAVDRWENIPTRYWFDSKKYPNGRYVLKIKTNIKSKTIPLIIQH